MIVGAPGVGKTRLARAALAEAEAAGAMSVWLRATASAASIPLAAVVDLLPEGAVAGDPLRVFQASTEALLTAACGLPFVLGVDDAHVLDAGSAALVLHLAGKGVFVVSTSGSAVVRRRRHHAVMDNRHCGWNWSRSARPTRCGLSRRCSPARSRHRRELGLHEQCGHSAVPALGVAQRGALGAALAAHGGAVSPA